MKLKLFIAMLLAAFSAGGASAQSSEILSELSGKLISVAANPADNLTTGQWYVMFDRGITAGKPHGYLYEDVSKHSLYNTATVPSGTTITAAKYLVRLSDAESGKYYVQTGYGNYFGAFAQSTSVPVTSTPTEAITIAKIANTDGHFYLQSTTSNIILDANDVGSGDATVVGWGTTVPTTTGGNNDWAFYPVSFEELGDKIALLAENVTVARGYQTCGRGNENSLMLRIDIEPFQNMTDATITVKLNATTRNNISSLYVHETTATEFIANIPASPIATASNIGATTTIELGAVKAGMHHFWLCATVKDDAKLGAILDASLTGINYTCNGESQSLNVASRGTLSRQGMKVFDQQHFVFRPTSDNCRFYRIPAMILDKDGNIVVSIDKRYNSNADLGGHKIDVISMRSEDGGRTWKDKVNVAVGDGKSEAYYGYGDPGLARAENGDLICLMAAGSKRWGANNTNGMKYTGLATSSNNGKSWTLTKNLFTSSKFYDEYSSNGKFSMSNYFTTSGKGLTTNDGVIMFATNCRKVGEGTNLVCIIYSTDNGNSWRLSKSTAYTGGDESKLEQMNDGSLLLSVRQSGNRGWNTATYTKNADGTVTFKWGTQKRTGDIWGNACNADILYYNRKTVEGMDILLHSYINTGGRESLQLAMSLDGGKSWKGVYNIQPNGSCYSTMIQLPNGNVALLYEDESYSAGNGYAINYVTITKEQILDWYKKNGGIVTDIDEGIRLETATDNAVYDLQGRRVTQSGKLPKGIYVQQGRKFVVK